MSTDFSTCPKYQNGCSITEEELSNIIAKAIRLNEQAIAEKAIEIAKKEFYQDVGKTVVTKLFLVIGLIAVGIVAWAHETGAILPHNPL